MKASLEQSGRYSLVLLRVIDLKDIQEVLLTTWQLVVMLLAMMVISIVVDKAGFFKWLAIHAARASSGNGRRLFLNTFLIGTAVTTVISNDATALIITPIVYGFVSELNLNSVPFLLVCTFIADTASLSLPVSNLTNLLVYDQLGLSFIPYIRAMFLPTLVAVVINYLVFRCLFSKSIPTSFPVSDLPEPEEFVNHQGFFRFSSWGLIVITFGYVIGSALGVPLYLIALFGALALLVYGMLCGQLTAKEVFSQVSWSVLVFVIGMFLVVKGIQKTGLPDAAGRYFLARANGSMLKGILYTAIGTALGSNLINNVPMDLLMVSTISTLPETTAIAPLAYATVLGAGLGPNLTVIGSLATMLWLATVRRKGVIITPMYYLKVGLLTAPLLIIGASLALWLSLLIFGY
jgi:arsenical pump membrane protein